MRIRLNKRFIIQSAALAFLFFLGLFSSIIYPRDPLKPGYSSGLTPPSSTFPMGTEQLGRDVFSWVLHGIRVAFYVGVTATLLCFAIALIVGAIAGYYGGIMDQILMRLTDLMMSIPRFILIVVFAILSGSNINNLILIIGGLSWPRLARIIRGEVLSLKEREFVLSAKVIGCGDLDILFSEILPNTIPTILPLLSLQMAHSVIDEVGISFLGFGDPEVPSWGRLIALGRAAIFAGGWWVLIWPCIVCAIFLLLVNLLADTLNDMLNPRTQG